MCFKISIGAIFTTRGNAALGEISNVDSFIGVELEEDKVSVTGWIDGLSVWIGALVTTSFYYQYYPLKLDDN